MPDPRVGPLGVVVLQVLVHEVVEVVWITVYSGFNNDESIRAAMDAGAWGFVDKLSRLSEIMDAMRRVAYGETVFPLRHVYESDRIIIRRGTRLRPQD